MRIDEGKEKAMGILARNTNTFETMGPKKKQRYPGGGRRPKKNNGPIISQGLKIWLHIRGVAPEGGEK